MTGLPAASAGRITCMKRTPRQAGSCREGLAPLHIICSENELRVQAIGGDACARASSRGRGRSEISVRGGGLVVVIRTLNQYCPNACVYRAWGGWGFPGRGPCREGIREKGERGPWVRDIYRSGCGKVCERYTIEQKVPGLKGSRGGPRVRRARTGLRTPRPTVILSTISNLLLYEV